MEKDRKEKKKKKKMWKRERETVWVCVQRPPIFPLFLRTPLLSLLAWREAPSGGFPLFCCTHETKKKKKNTNSLRSNPTVNILIIIITLLLLLLLLAFELWPMNSLGCINKEHCSAPLSVIHTYECMYIYIYLDAALKPGTQFGSHPLKTLYSPPIFSKTVS